jgi:hypothetical protein
MLLALLLAFIHGQTKRVVFPVRTVVKKCVALVHYGALIICLIWVPLTEISCQPSLLFPLMTLGYLVQSNVPYRPSGVRDSERSDYSLGADLG